jgi:hypothetical protein
MKKSLASFLIIGASLFIIAFAIPAHADLVNGNFSAGNSGFTTGYGFIPSGMSTTPGTYAIRTSSQDFNSGYNLFGDHTTGTGNMMLLDGTSGTVAWQETVSVATNTSYTFSGWAALSDGSNPPGLIFTINGVQVGATLVLANTPGVWQNFTVGWSSGTTNSATIAVTDNNGVSLGNDFALDDFSFITNSPVPATIYTAVEINWNSQVGQSYQVQSATALNTNNWINFGAPVQGSGTNNSVFDSTRGQPMKFYRVLAQP